MSALQKPRGLFRTGVGTALPHDSAAKHVTGAAIYVDDMPEPPGMLHAALVLSPIAHGFLRGIDAGAVLAQPGVIAVFGANDIPGLNDAGPIGPNELLFAEHNVEFAGQPIAAVVAET